MMIMVEEDALSSYLTEELQITLEHEIYHTAKKIISLLRLSSVEYTKVNVEEESYLN